MRGRRSLLVAAVGLAALSLLGGQATFARFTKQTTSSANSIGAAPDWVAPTVSATVISKSPGYSAGFVKQGGTYFVYANVADAGNPGERHQLGRRRT